MGFAGSWSSGSSHHTTNCASGSSGVASPLTVSKGAGEAGEDCGASNTPPFSLSYAVSPTFKETSLFVTPTSGRPLGLFSPEDGSRAGACPMSRKARAVSKKSIFVGKNYRALLALILPNLVASEAFSQVSRIFQDRSLDSVLAQSRVSRGPSLGTWCMGLMVY